MNTMVGQDISTRLAYTGDTEDKTKGKGNTKRAKPEPQEINTIIRKLTDVITLN